MSASSAGFPLSICHELVGPVLSTYKGSANGCSSLSLAGFHDTCRVLCPQASMGGGGAHTAKEGSV
ncbi:hypothetical protein CGRA01v4_11063 [Colletotrichum graminicola]|nr:hypothetical protein CGRA01v4_11063 [Colletotrichum graminicola]